METITSGCSSVHLSKCVNVWKTGHRLRIWAASHNAGMWLLHFMFTTAQGCLEPLWQRGSSTALHKVEQHASSRRMSQTAVNHRSMVHTVNTGRHPFRTDGVDNITWGLNMPQSTPSQGTTEGWPSVHNDRNPSRTKKKKEYTSSTNIATDQQQNGMLTAAQTSESCALPMMADCSSAQADVPTAPQKTPDQVFLSCTFSA